MIVTPCQSYLDIHWIGPIIDNRLSLYNLRFAALFTNLHVTHVSLRGECTGFCVYSPGPQVYSTAQPADEAYLSSLLSCLVI